MTDPTAENRKQDHIELAFESQLHEALHDSRFYYEPVLSGHHPYIFMPEQFLGKKINLPLWISSMTGGTQKAGAINKNLARACKEYGLGMGLGSCRSLLYSDTHFEDFNLRPLIGNNLPFYANLGIAQVEKLLLENNLHAIKNLVKKLDADGLIVHLNPLQEFLQPEGDRLKQSPLITLEKLLDAVQFPVIVKEVGQGMGPESIAALLQLPIAALDFGAYGGTNFSKLELLRSATVRAEALESVSLIGHTAEEMIRYVADVVNAPANTIRCQQIIISGGVKSFLDGYYLMHTLSKATGGNMQAIYAQGSAFLKHAQNSYEALAKYIESQRDGLALCASYLKVRS